MRPRQPTTLRRALLGGAVRGVTTWGLFALGYGLPTLVLAPPSGMRLL